ncbi:MAG: hypothetical protein AVDCRST_MAG75-3055 [uncultured Propionibacteriaceae bacterium]|uniref:Uncharacterized protein n=1 Tax=uncultured Propionibacteriaceae bacterium TaxID=257457 RepID=A0A6J4PI44_9ACTN|nr:MAG: hypothetical protein AVDCRST_MAG75-3055 [uncultured Propionibacteriaceae bacterium]
MRDARKPSSGTHASRRSAGKTNVAPGAGRATPRLALPGAVPQVGVDESIEYGTLKMTFSSIFLVTTVRRRLKP